MDDKLLLMIPGPTSVPEEIRLAIAKPPIPHRSQAFSDLFSEVSEGLRWLHQTQSDVYILTASGTGAMEAGIVNVLSPGDRVLCGVNGKFGQRWADMADAFGLQCERLESPWGTPYCVEEFQTRLESDPEKTIKAIILTHCETSTGVLNDIPAIAKLAQAHGEALVIVDAVTSVGALPVLMDEWGLDIVVSGSQKAYMLPPGLGFVAVSQRALVACERSKLPKYYWNFLLAARDLARGFTPFTPSVNLIYGLQVALQKMQKEGLNALFHRHQVLAQSLQAGIKALGLSLVATPASAASPSVTAVYYPEGIHGDTLRHFLIKEFDIAIADGQDAWKNKIFRIGHMGFIQKRDIITTLGALESGLSALGYQSIIHGCSIEAALQKMQQLF
jgi:aspartate aminotransferase-like enzyme